MLQHPPSPQVSELPFALRFSTSEFLRHIQHPGQGGKERQEHPPLVLSSRQRKGSAGSACGSLESSSDLAVNTPACPAPLQGRGGFLCHRSLSPLPQRLLPPTSIPNTMQPSASSKAVISHSPSALHKHQHGEKRSALDELKDNSSCLVQLLTPLTQPRKALSPCFRDALHKRTPRFFLVVLFVVGFF